MRCEPGVGKGAACSLGMDHPAVPMRGVGWVGEWLIAVWMGVIGLKSFRGASSGRSLCVLDGCCLGRRYFSMEAHGMLVCDF